MLSVADRIQMAKSRFLSWPESYAKHKEQSGHWITIGGSSGEKGEHEGGTHIQIDGDGKILAGPKGLADKGIRSLSDFDKGKSGEKSEELSKSDPSVTTEHVASSQLSHEESKADLPTAKEPEPETKADQEIVDLCKKYGRTPVDGATKRSFSVFGLSKGDNGDSNGEVKFVKGKRYLQVDRSTRSYWSRDDLEDQDMFSHEPGGAYNWTGIEVEPTEKEAASDKEYGDYQASDKAFKARKADIESQVRKSDNHKYEIKDRDGLKALPNWGASRMAGSETMYSDGKSRLVYCQSSYDDGPHYWELNDPELAKEASSLTAPTKAGYPICESSAKPAEKLASKPPAVKREEKPPAVSSSKKSSATWTKLKSGDWGLRIEGTAKAGDSVTVRKRSGETSSAKVGKVVWSGNGVTLCEVSRYSQQCYLNDRIGLAKSSYLSALRR